MKKLLSVFLVLSSLFAVPVFAQTPEISELLQMLNGLEGSSQTAPQQTPPNPNEITPEQIQEMVDAAGGDSIAPAIEITLEPSFPQPGETVTASLNDYTPETSHANKIWRLDGVEIPNSAGKRSVKFTAGPSGVAQTISVSLATTGQEQTAFTKVFTPLFLDIIIEPYTHTPDFYQGRALPSPFSEIYVTALLDGKYFNRNDLVYTWRINRTVIEGGPVYGRNWVLFTLPRGDANILSLTVATADGTRVAARSLYMPSVNPELHFYNANPLFGISSVAWNDSSSLIGSSMTLQAEPYYLDSNTYNNPELKEWELDGAVVDNGSSNPYEITLQKTGASGYSTVNFHVRNLDQVLQGAENDTRVNF